MFKFSKVIKRLQIFCLSWTVTFLLETFFPWLFVIKIKDSRSNINLSIILSLFSNFYLDLKETEKKWNRSNSLTIILLSNLILLRFFSTQLRLLFFSLTQMNKQLSEFFGEEFKLASQASMGPLKHVTATLTFHSIKGQKEDFFTSWQTHSFNITSVTVNFFGWQQFFFTSFLVTCLYDRIQITVFFQSWMFLISYIQFVVINFFSEFV